MVSSLVQCFHKSLSKNVSVKYNNGRGTKQFRIKCKYIPEKQ